jgi:two-component sensor histidine kinase
MASSLNETGDGLAAGDELLPEDGLRLRLMFLEAVANSSADGILVVDHLGRKIFQNQRTIDLWKIPPEVVADPDGDRQVAHVMHMTKNPQAFLEEIEHQKLFPFDVTTDQLELIDGTVLDRHSAPVIGGDGKNYGRIYHFHDVTTFRQAEDKIQGLLDEKEILLREVHHRVKNYMSTLLSLLSLQTASLTEPAAINALEDAQSRVQGMVMLYDKLYVSTGSGKVLVSHELPMLIDEIIATLPKYVPVVVDKSVDSFTLGAKTMQTLGMITNELLTNIMKYAFVGRSSGHISVSLRLEGKRAAFVVQDDGIGIPESADKRSSTGFGMMLVRILVKQLGGAMSIERREGTRFSLDFEV